MAAKIDPKQVTANAGAQEVKGPTSEPTNAKDLKNAYDQLRSVLEQSADQTKKALDDAKKHGGGPNAQKVKNDNVLQGDEWKKTQAALGSLKQAVTALKPVFPRADPKQIDRAVIAMPEYGVPLRDDLSHFRDRIEESMQLINDAKDTPNALSSAESAEANKAYGYLQKALTALGNVEW